MTQVAKEVVLFLSTEGSALLTVQPRFGRTRCWSSREDGLPGSRPGPHSNARWPLAVAWGGGTSWKGLDSWRKQRVPCQRTRLRVDGASAREAWHPWNHAPLVPQFLSGSVGLPVGPAIRRAVVIGWGTGMGQA